MSNKVDYLFDSRMLRASGIGTYLQNLLPRVRPQLRGSVVAICHRRDAETLERWGYEPCVRDTGMYSPQESLLGWRHLPKSEWLWVPHFNVPLIPSRHDKLLVTIHDLFHRDQGFRLPWAQQMYSRLLLQNALLRADRVVAVSGFTQSRIAHYYPAAANKVRVIHNGGPDLDTQLSVDEPVLMAGKKYVLMVGNVKPHKNIAKAIEAFHKFRTDHPEFELVIVGNHQGMLNAASIENLSAPYIHFTGFVEQQELVGYYRHCAFFLFPSLYEGFGLPVLEAASHGATVCCSRIPPVVEIAHPSCIFFDPNSSDDMVVAMKKALGAPAIPSEERIQWLAQYQWDRCAEKHLEVMHEFG